MSDAQARAAWDRAIATVVARRALEAPERIDERLLGWWVALDDVVVDRANEAARIRQHEQGRRRQLRALRELDPRLPSRDPVSGRALTARELASRLRHSSRAS